jgi:GAF domain-containing protein
MAAHEPVAAAVAELCDAINAPLDPESRLGVLVEVARRSMPEIDHVGISVAYRDGHVETKAATSDLVHELDQLQYSLGEGPCLHAIEAEPVVVVQDARHDSRWPRFMKVACERGLRSQLGLRLYLDDHARGGLNLYSVSSDVIDPETEQLAELFATHAALIMGRARSEANLHASLASRTAIEIALGLVMERFGLDQDRAFSYLTRMASTSETKLRDVAQHLVEDANDRNRVD